MNGDEKIKELGMRIMPRMAKAAKTGTERQNLDDNEEKRGTQQMGIERLTTTGRGSIIGPCEWHTSPMDNWLNVVRTPI
uniref:Uncharacterized protein n=1 Tax=Rhizophora mucronata TaxID=61149 RepID=A0A2P2PU23_RHIMU